MPNDGPPTNRASAWPSCLRLAIAFGRCEHPASPLEIDMYGSGPEITTLGVGISFWPWTWEIMLRLGLHDELMQEAVKSKGHMKDQGEGSKHQAGGDD
ncbi:uncharacterized protein BXZ73DRAFT_108300 [Epithele typhae]|uniref:uncharacterized protein n=1 Tax=Epithele typhae TaxID=378194 RepID=UPI002007B352|nr:uncharacterized protein BXZ73DRAFT_108300 [Epithele typhae]KAH9911018.1 hypothetical protein BXZ73DRAFT_108300 [Epithele typhae]